MADILTQYGPDAISTITRGFAGGGMSLPRGGGGSFPDMSGLINLRIQMQQEQEERERRKLEMAERAEMNARRIENAKLAMAKEQMKKDQYAKDRAYQDNIRAQRTARADADRAAQLVTKHHEGGFNYSGYTDPDQDAMNLNRLRYAAQQGRDLNSNLPSAQVSFGDITGTEEERAAQEARRRGQVAPSSFSWSDRADIMGWGRGR